MQGDPTSRPAGADSRGFLALVRALVASSVDLVHNASLMAASEGRVVIERAALRLAVLLGALLVAATGFLLALVGGALALARAAELEPWIAFVLVGAVTLTIGAVLAVRAMRRLADPDLLFPATISEIRSDMEMLRAGRHDPEAR